jgi:hypothetical protein
MQVPPCPGLFAAEEKIPIPTEYENQKAPERSAHFEEDINLLSLPWEVITLHLPYYI